MKIFGIILAALMLVGTLFVGLAGANKSFELAGDLDKLVGGLTDAQAAALEQVGAKAPPTGRLKTGAFLGLASCALGFAMFLAIFVKRGLVMPLAIAAVAVSAIAVGVYPFVETGPLDGMAPRTQQIVGTVLVALTAVGAVLAKLGADKKAAAAAPALARAA